MNEHFLKWKIKQKIPAQHRQPIYYALVGYNIFYIFYFCVYVLYMYNTLLNTILNYLLAII